MQIHHKTCIHKHKQNITQQRYKLKTNIKTLTGKKKLFSFFLVESFVSVFPFAHPYFNKDKQKNIYTRLVCALI